MEGRLSLSELQLMIRDSLYLALPDFFWVAGEISEFKENNSGHCYLELIEKSPDELNPRAKIKAIIWAGRAGFLKSFFKSSTSENLDAGLKVLVRAKIEYHELYGLSLIITDIDPSYTIGEMAIKRQLIISKLREEGILEMNKELTFPAVPQRIAVISSTKAAGYTDFINHLSGNSRGYVFYTSLFEAVMQGSETEKSIISALDRIAEYADKFDVVAIIRGGGSQSDLSWFDNYNIAFHITQFPLPVITGIGHEKDISVTDIVAFESLKTPTAVADYLISAITDTEDHIMAVFSGIGEYALNILTASRNRLEAARAKLIPTSGLMVAGNRTILSGKVLELINKGKGYIIKAGITPASHSLRLSSASTALCKAKRASLDRIEKDILSVAVTNLSNRNIRLESLENALNILDPVNVLSRGYTITSSAGKILKSAAEVSGNEVIDTKFCDGTIKSKVL